MKAPIGTALIAIFYFTVATSLLIRLGFSINDEVIVIEPFVALSVYILICSLGLILMKRWARCFTMINATISLFMLFYLIYALIKTQEWHILPVVVFLIPIKILVLAHLSHERVQAQFE